MKTDLEGFRDAILILAGIAILLALMRMASDIIVPFLLSLFIAIIAATPFNWLKKRGLGTLISAMIVIMAIVVIISLLALLLGSTAAQFTDALPGYQSRLDSISSSFSAALEEKGITVSQAGLLNVIDASAVMSFANNMVVGMGNALSYGMLIVFTVIFMLIDAAGFPRKLAAIEGQKSEATLNRLAEVMDGLNQYVVAKAIVSLVTAVLIWIALAMIGLDFAPL